MACTILVIDDDDAVRESIMAYLELGGFDVIQARHGEEGLALFQECSPDLILCDLRMPKMDGLNVLKAVREVSFNMPFIVISGANVMSDVVEALRLGANDYITKPVADLEILEYSINRSLETAQIAMENSYYRHSLEDVVQSLEQSVGELQADQNAGRQVQMKMLPQEPLVFKSFRVEHQVTPSLYLSGDFVDYFALNDHSFAFYLADVSGHGASSAFITVLLKQMSLSLLKEYQTRNRHGKVKPSQVLSYINRNLLDSDLGKHVTVFGGVVDSDRQTLTYSFGGHFPLPVLSTEKETRLLEGRGLPVGLFKNARFTNHTIDLPRQFTLTVLSDGVLEMLPQKTLSEKESCLLSMIQEGAKTVSALTQRLRLDVIEEAPDDIAMLILAQN